MPDPRFPAHDATQIDLEAWLDATEPVTESPPEELGAELAADLDLDDELVEATSRRGLAASLTGRRKDV